MEVKVRFENGFWVDDNNNKWSSYFLDAWDEHGALELAKTLVNCKNCVDCVECVDCVDCVDCEMCSCCYDCERLFGCEGCEWCTDCTHEQMLKNAHKGEVKNAKY